MLNVLILCSSEPELAPLRALAPGLMQSSVSTINVYQGQYAGCQLGLALTGVGLVNAAMVSSLLAQALNPDVILFCGVAGAVARDLNIGDVVVASEVAQAELFTTMAAVENTPFVDYMRNPMLNKFPPAWYASLSLPEITFNNQKFKTRIGRVVTTDQFPAPVKEYAMLLKENVCALDMETAAIYQVGWVMNIPTLAVRAISNKILADGTDPDMHAADVIAAPKNAAQITLKLIREVVSNKLEMISLNH